MPKLMIKPLTVNKCWRGGRRFKTNDYLIYEKEACYLLPVIKIPNPASLKLEIGLSNKRSDIDNILKPFIDILQHKYNFDDNIIFKIEVEKNIVKKGEEYINFEFKKYENL